MMTGTSNIYGDQQQQANSIRMGSPIGLRDPSPAYRSSPNLSLQQQQQQQQATLASSSSSISSSSHFGTSAIRFRSSAANSSNQHNQHGITASDQSFKDERYGVLLSSLLFCVLCVCRVFIGALSQPRGIYVIMAEQSISV